MTEAGTPLSRRVGEVVGANSSSFMGQCYRLYDAPPLGCLVRTSSPEIYGVVCRVSTELWTRAAPYLHEERTPRARMRSSGKTPNWNGC